jgi:hypothetical protein
MKKFLKNILVIAATATIALSTSVFAQSNAYTQPVQPDPLPQFDLTGFTSISEFKINVNSNFQGLGGGAFTGEEGQVQINEDGSSFSDFSIAIIGGGCVVDCAERSNSAESGANHSINIQSFALGSIAGDTVQSTTQGSSLGHGSIVLEQMNLVSPITTLPVTNTNGGN